MIKEKAMKSNINISTELDGIPELIHADERKLKQILYNLLSNAVKFTPNGGSIELVFCRVTLVVFNSSRWVSMVVNASEK